MSLSGVIYTGVKVQKNVYNSTSTSIIVFKCTAMYGSYNGMLELFSSQLNALLLEYVCEEELFILFMRDEVSFRFFVVKTETKFTCDQNWD